MQPASSHAALEGTAFRRPPPSTRLSDRRPAIGSGTKATHLAVLDHADAALLSSMMVSSATCMSASLVPATMMLWLSWPTLLADRAALEAEILEQAMGEPSPFGLAVALDDGDEAEAVACRAGVSQSFSGRLDGDLVVEQDDAGQRGADGVGRKRAASAGPASSFSSASAA